MGKRMRFIATGLLCAALCTPAMAWGPRSQLAIVTTAAHLLAKSGNIPITRLAEDLQNGSRVSENQMKALYPDLASSAVNAIESEMYLLQAVRGDRVDPYFAFRLGVLGKLVASTTAPLHDAKPTYRNLYYADVEGNITTELQESERRRVSPREYFASLQAEIRQNDELILSEYESGVGFEGVARNTLPTAASRSVMAVADVWYTVLTGASVSGGVSDTQLRTYVLDAWKFYIARGSAQEMDAAEARYGALVDKTSDMQVKIGDMLYEGEFPERAMEEYEAVLASDPNRRDVTQKISNYYMDLGEAALEKEQLEGAQQYFARALDVNPLHPTAQARKLQAEKLISERNARQAADQQALEQAAEFQVLAETEVRNRRFAEAIVLLRQALLSYEEVSTEFPIEARKGEEGLADTRSRIEMLKRELVNNTQGFSGSGDALDAPRLASQASEGLDKEVLEQLVSQEYEAAITVLEQGLTTSLSPQQPE